MPKPSHATVIAYLALFAALGGSAYAVSKVGTSDLKRNAVTSAKIEQRAVKGSDIAREAVGVKQLRARPGAESAAVADCDPSGPTPVECARIGIRLEQRGAIVGIASGGQYSAGGPAAGRCSLQVAGEGGRSPGAQPGETATVNSDALATNGFGTTSVLDGLSAGPQSLALLCSETRGDFRLAGVDLTAIALPGVGE